MKKTRTFALLLALAGLAAIPGGTASAANQSCKHPTVTRSFVVTGTLVSWNGNTVEITVRNANRAARNSGELEDQNPNRKGVQVRGGSYSVSDSSDSFNTYFSGYESGEQPAAGDKVRIRGRIAYTKKRCAPEGTSTADRYATPNVKRVRFIDADGN